VFEHVAVNHGSLGEEHQTRAPSRHNHLELRLAMKKKNNGEFSAVRASRQNDCFALPSLAKCAHERRHASLSSDPPSKPLEKNGFFV
jgi:hypothetical protein